MSETSTPTVYESIGLDESITDDGKKELLFEVIRDWVSLDGLYTFLDQDKSRDPLVSAYAAGETDEYPIYELPVLPEQVVENRLQLIETFDQINSVLVEELDEDDPHRQTVELKMYELAKKTKYLQLMLEHQKAYAEGDEAAFESSGREMMEIAKEIYGEVPEETFLGVVGYIKRGIEKSDYDKAPDAEAVKQEFYEMLPDVEPGSSEFEVRQELMDDLREILYEEWGDYLAIIDENPPENGETYTHEERVVIYNMVLDLMREKGLEHNWTAVLKPERKADMVEHRLEEIWVAGNRSRGEPTIEEFKQVLAHEALVHVLSRVKGENSEAPLTGLGLPGSIISQEGLGKMAEQVVRGKYTPGGVNYNLAMGYAEGIAGLDQHDAQEVNELMWRRKYLFKLKSVKGELTQEEADALKQSCKKAADVTCRRVFRSSTGKMKAVYYPKDRSYDNENVWRHLDELHRTLSKAEFRAEVLKMLSARYDIFSESQSDLIDRLKLSAAA